jgi:hypothetical protein
MVLIPEDHIQKARVSWHEARRKYESLGAKSDNEQARIQALHEWNATANDLFLKQADSFLATQPDNENSWNVTYAERVLNELAGHHAAVGKAATQLGLEPKALLPPFIKFKRLQSFVLAKEPEIAQSLRNRFITLGLPTYGFEPAGGLEWKRFSLGCALLFVAVGLMIWGFSLGTLTQDQRRLLVWLLPLASGFAVCAFAGSLSARTSHGIFVSAAGSFAIWTITFFYLFPESKLKEVTLAPQSFTPSEAASDVNIASVDIVRRTHTRMILGVIPNGEQYVTSFTLRIINKRQQMMRYCQGSFQYALVSGGHTAGGALMAGTLEDWYNGKALSSYFTLSRDLMSAYDFISFPTDDKLPRPAWLRVRVYDDHDFVSPWFDIDLSKVLW